MPADYSDLLVRLQCCHSILNTAWPRPGVPQMAGARAFIGTKLFRALETSASQIAESIEALAESRLKTELLEAWKSLAKVVHYLKASGKEANSGAVDRAFNLLYLVTGIAYHRVGGELAMKPQQDERFATVEDVADLLRLCAWSPREQTEGLAQLLRELVADLEAVAEPA